MAANDKTIFPHRENNPLESLNSMSSAFSTVMGLDALADIELDPYVSGYSFIYWLRLPSWFSDDPDLKYFKTLTQKCMRSFQGITDINVTDVQKQEGFAGNETNFISGVQRGNTEFTIGMKEYSGTPITKMFTKWISLIRDPNTGIALYPKLYNVEYSARNHTAVLLYIACRPDVTNVNKNVVEKAILYANVYPTNIPLSSLFNYELGSQESPTSIDINFKGVPLMGNQVDEYAEKVLKENIISVSEDNPNGILFIDSLTKNGDPGTELLNSGILKDIYNTPTED